MTRRWQIAVGMVVASVLVTSVMVAQGAPNNPRQAHEPAWDRPETRALALRAGCFDCHSNQTVWPWYTSLPIAGQLVKSHVEEGREKFNFSRMDLSQEEAHEAGEVVAEGEMPPAYYTFLHPSARLTQAERAQLIAGLNATFGGEADERGEESDGEEQEEEEEEDEDDD